MGSGIASGVAESLSILAATAPRPGSTVPISRPQRSVTDSKTANSHRFRRATPLNSRRSILMAFNLRPSVLLQESSGRSEEHTSELQSRLHLVCRLLLEKKKPTYIQHLSSYALAHMSS